MSATAPPITGRAFARAGLVGNPSDGYFGKTISFAIRDFAAEVTLTPSNDGRVEITHGEIDRGRYAGVSELIAETRLMGYYGATRLMKAAVVRYHEEAEAANVELGPGGFTLDYETSIPRLVGMSGSSAIVIATLRALMKFYGHEVPKGRLPTVALEVETKLLDIAAGLQDRVIQTYEGLVFMDFDRQLVESTGGGRYEPLTPGGTLPIYVAFDAQRAEISGVTHRNLRAAWEAGEPDVVEAMDELRGLTDRGRAAIEGGDWLELHRVTDANYDVRKRIMPIAPENQRMIDVARAAGASAKFGGSGGAICGVYRTSDEYDALRDALAEIGCTTFKPTIFPAAEETT